MRNANSSAPPNSHGLDTLTSVGTDTRPFLWVSFFTLAANCMADSEIDKLIARLLAASACSVSPASRIIAMPDALPADVRHFFTRCAGGRLYYHPDYPTPQFGCVLRFHDQPVTHRLPCDGPEFDWLYTVAEFDEGEEDCVVVSANPDTCGYIYRLNYSLGGPPLTTLDAHLLAPTFTRWLAMHVQAWDIYLDDWREGLKHFERLIEHERQAA